jgi:transcriptional regulator with XRE-family HTH domain
MKQVASHFKAQRLAQSLSLGDLARLIGYKNTGKGANRIVRFEREGVIDVQLLIKLALALAIDWATVQELAEQDRQEHIEEWNKWADEPVPMRLIIKWIPAVYSERLLPVEITTPEEAEAFACDQARHFKKQTCLVLNRRRSVWIGADGVVTNRTEATPFGGPNQPWMQLKGRRFLLDITPEA